MREYSLKDNGKRCIGLSPMRVRVPPLALVIVNFLCLITYTAKRNRWEAQGLAPRMSGGNGKTRSL